MHQGQSAKDVLQLLEGGLIIAGILLFILGITGLVDRILRLFTPLVTGTFLLILALQLSGVWVRGIAHIISSLFSTIGIVPLPASAGFIQLTGQRKVKSFLIASLILAGISFIPSIVSFISLLPGPIANAALLATYVQVIGLSGDLSVVMKNTYFK